MEIIHQPLDFLGFNCYQSGMVKAGENGQPEAVDYENDHPLTHFDWPVTPQSLRWGCTFLHERYQKPLIVTENGLSLNDWVSVDGQVHDPKRIDFLTRYIAGVKKAVESGVDIQGYFQWSILDNFEWAEGYAHRFGLVHVDYKTQKRTVKDSGHWYKKLIECNGSMIDSDCSMKHW
jgi:beta-glucosidase